MNSPCSTPPVQRRTLRGGTTHQPLSSTKEHWNLTQTRITQANIKVDIATTTGSINIGLKIDEVGAIIKSQVGSFGDIFTETNNFSGEKNMLQSNNYPAETNIEIDNTVSGFGDINIHANYQSDTTAA